ncbi:MAG: ABC transporter permease [Ruminiclostridium sp.]|nr:ABC transporter permease [Ruminiclostridium sp.]
MFLHNLKYELLGNLRAPALIAWLMIFPVFLGTVFKIGFGSIYENNDLFTMIPTAVVETEKNEIFDKVIDSVSGSEQPLLKVTRVGEQEALELLKNGEVKGIIRTDGEISLTVAGKGIEQTILKSFIEQYSTYEMLIEDTIKNAPDKLPEVIERLSEDAAVCTEIPLTQGDADPYDQYFYNLIAMVAMFGSVTGLHITENSQANMSALGARKNCSPTPKPISITSSLVGSFMAQGVCMIICVTFLHFILKVDFGDRLPLVYAAALVGGCMGVTFGFFIGSIGRLSSEMKNGIAMTVSMVLCFMSGLMIGNMKTIIAENLPWFNNINPVAIVSDCFYCLNLYSDLDRFNFKMLSMAAYIVVFAVLGIILSRRKKYASI